jgi:hypothetical protein
MFAFYFLSSVEHVSFLKNSSSGQSNPFTSVHSSLYVFLLPFFC